MMNKYYTVLKKNGKSEYFLKIIGFIQLSSTVVYIEVIKCIVPYRNDY